MARLAPCMARTHHRHSGLGSAPASQRATKATSCVMIGLVVARFAGLLALAISGSSSRGGVPADNPFRYLRVRTIAKKALTLDSGFGY